MVLPLRVLVHVTEYCKVTEETRWTLVYNGLARIGLLTNFSVLTFCLAINRFLL